MRRKTRLVEFFSTCPFFEVKRSFYTFVAPSLLVCCRACGVQHVRRAMLFMSGQCCAAHVWCVHHRKESNSFVLGRSKVRGGDHPEQKVDAPNDSAGARQRKKVEERKVASNRRGGALGVMTTNKCAGIGGRGELSMLPLSSVLSCIHSPLDPPKNGKTAALASQCLTSWGSALLKNNKSSAGDAIDKQTTNKGSKKRSRSAVRTCAHNCQHTTAKAKQQGQNSPPALNYSLFLTHL